jgi:hypothetical protein
MLRKYRNNWKQVTYPKQILLMPKRLKYPQSDMSLAKEYLTNYSGQMAQNTFNKWKTLSEYLIVKYIDGNIKKEKDGKFERNRWGNPVMPLQPGYSDAWKKSVIQETGDKLLDPTKAGH